MHQPVTQNQIRNTECQAKIFFLQFEKRIDSRVEFVTGGVELLRAILHGYAGGLIFMK